MAAPITSVGEQRARALEQALAQVPAQRCPRLGALDCQRTDDHSRGHVYHGAWAPDRHDELD